VVVTDCTIEAIVEGAGNSSSEEGGACGGEAAGGREVGMSGR